MLQSDTSKALYEAVRAGFGRLVWYTHAKFRIYTSALLNELNYK